MIKDISKILLETLYNVDKQPYENFVNYCKNIENYFISKDGVKIKSYRIKQKIYYEKLTLLR